MDPIITPSIAAVAMEVFQSMLHDGDVSGWTAILPSLASKGLELSGHFGKELLVLHLEKHLMHRLGSPHEALRNHHLMAAVGLSIKMVILKAAEDEEFVMHKSKLERIANGAPSFWSTLASAEITEFEQLTDGKLTELFAVPAASHRTLTVLDVPTWENFLRSCGSTKDKLIVLPSEVVREVAGLLHRTVPHALREVLKHDAESGGAAFAGLQLMFFGELLATCLELRNDQKALRQLVAETAGDVVVRQTEVVERLDGLAKQISTQSEAVFARLPEIVRHEFREEGLRQDTLFQQLLAVKKKVMLPFRPVEDRENFGNENQADAFAPSRSEYREGLVHRPALANLVEQSLMDCGYAMVEGHGASGKTVLAFTVALGERFRDHTAYYLDLTDFDEANANVVEKLLVLVSDKVLFIVDNVHLNKRAAQDLFDAWQGNPSGSRLLLLGRHVEPRPDCEGRQALLGDLNPSAVHVLKIEATDLVGAFKRLAHREIGPADIPVPPSEWQQRWLDLFQGDLIVFSAAVRARLSDLVGQDWKLSAEDARQYVRDRYLYRKEVSEKERHCLLTVAVLARLELATPEEVLKVPEFNHSIKCGVVYHSLSGGKFAHYRLNHPRMGDLLLGVATEPVDERQVWLESARRSPSCGAAIAMRFQSLGERTTASAVLREALQQPKALKDCTRAGLNNLANICRLADRLGLMDTVQQLGPWDQRAEVLAHAAERTLFFDLASFLNYTQKTNAPELKGLFQVVAKHLDEKKLVKQAELATPEDINYFLKCARDIPELKRLFTPVLQHLNADKILAAQAERKSLLFLDPFLHYAQMTPELKGLYAAVVAKLDAGKLVEQAERTPLDGLASFLSYARNTRELKGLYAAVVAKLDAGKIAEQAKRAPLEHLTSFLAFARTTPELKALYAAVIVKLNQPVTIIALAQNACTTPLPHFVRFIRDAPLADAVVRAIDLEAWNTARSTARDESPNYLHALFKELYRLGRLELAEAPAVALIRLPDPAIWHVSDVHLPQVTQTLRLGQSAGIDAQRKFLENVVTPDWLYDQYADAKPGVIAATLFAVRSLWVPEFLDHFVRALPDGLLSQPLARLYRADPDEAIGTLSLLGVYDLLELPVDIRGVRWPPTVPVHRFKSVPELRASWVLFCLGLRAMAKYRSDQITVPSETGTHILTLWRQAETHTPQAGALNQWMIVWLERCAASGWILLQDTTPFVLPSNPPS